MKNSKGELTAEGKTIVQEGLIEELRRGVAAMTLLIAGPTRLGSLDPAHVLIGGGAALTEEEKRELSIRLGESDKHLVFQEYSFDGISLRLERLHVAESREDGVYWWDDCICWVPAPGGEVKLVPMHPDARGHFANRGGRLKYFAFRPPVAHKGVVAAAKRMAGIVARLEPADYAGQSLDDLEERGLRYWQTEGFRIREDGRELTPEQAAAIHRFRQDG